MNLTSCRRGLGRRRIPGGSGPGPGSSPFGSRPPSPVAGSRHVRDRHPIDGVHRRSGGGTLAGEPFRATKWGGHPCPRAEQSCLVGKRRLRACCCSIHLRCLRQLASRTRSQWGTRCWDTCSRAPTSALLMPQSTKDPVKHCSAVIVGGDGDKGASPRRSDVPAHPRRAAPSTPRGRLYGQHSSDAAAEVDVEACLPSSPRTDSAAMARASQSSGESGHQAGSARVIRPQTPSNRPVPLPATQTGMAPPLLNVWEKCWKDRPG